MLRRKCYYKNLLLANIVLENFALEKFVVKENARQTLNWFTCYLKISESFNQLRLFMDQFVHYIHGKVCRYQEFNIIA